MLHTIQIEVTYAIARVGLQTEDGIAAAHHWWRQRDRTMVNRFSRHGIIYFTEINIQLMIPDKMIDFQRIIQLNQIPIQLQGVELAAE